jgi:nitrous oxidase accessory protein NosD
MGTKGAIIDVQHDTYVFNVVSKSRVTFKGFYIKGNGRVAIGGTSTAGNAAIHARLSSNIIIENMEIRSIGRLVVFFSGVTTGIVRDCILEGAGTGDGKTYYAVGTWSEYQMSQQEDSHDISVTGNTIWNCNANGIGLYNVTGFQVVNNYVHTCKQGIACSPARNGLIANNRVENCPATGEAAFEDLTAGEGGIEVETAVYHVSGNATSSESFGITIVGNHVQDCEWGIYTRLVNSTLLVPVGVMIANNVVRTCDIGYHLEKGNRIGLVGNVAVENTTNITVDADVTNVTNANNVTD